MRRVSWIVAIGAIAASALALFSACSTSDPELDPAADASTIDVAVDTWANPGYDLDGTYGGPDYERVRLMNDRCYGAPLDTDDGGLVHCHVILFFPVFLQCVDLGLPDPSKSDAQYLVDYSAANGVPLPEGTFCGLDQAPAGTCVDDFDPGVLDPNDAEADDADAGDASPPARKETWCYVRDRGCYEDASCNEALCTSNSYSADASTYVWLACP